ncbi:C40 family peptidase [Actinoallomurus bryophytorum]|uniref:Cell wall-associated NlpC family hydrolase n=1 Tax=Actinoallomurus bryophytorum TaxID=1490222 RepID=A0A543CSR6_9ACTN|nr:NlpC/P60 family protein [Actinoallomurus bryophytorum]TQM00156.1 cell wall-associated NlpC family hydrolase [Actinoallomurus bryophytorum]
MEPSRSAKAHHRKHRTGKTVVTGILLVAGLSALPARHAGAKPAPGIDTLRQQAGQLNTQLEQLTEQYDGLRVRLQQAQRAAEVAKATSTRETKALKSIQQRVGRLAALRYMHGGTDEAPALFAAPDPQALLDQAATLHYFTQQDDTQVRQLTQAIQTAEHAWQNAQVHATQAAGLKTQLKQKKATIQKTLDKVRKPLLKDAVERAGRGESVPVIPGGPTKAIGAVRAALSQLGVPYVWGGATPGGGFDCSGLTMWAYRQVGVNLPHYGGDQWNAGVHVSRSQLQPGDLVFFYSDIHHMGMYLGDGKFVHAPHTGDRVRVADLATRPFAGAVRIV